MYSFLSYSRTRLSGDYELDNRQWLLTIPPAARERKRGRLGQTCFFAGCCTGDAFNTVNTAQAKESRQIEQPYFEVTGGDYFTKFPLEV